MNARRDDNNRNKVLSGKLENALPASKSTAPAGLAVSEKLHAQITSLNAAQKDVKEASLW